MSFFKKIFGSPAATPNHYAEFWSWFQKNEKLFYQTVKEKKDVQADFFSKLAPQLGKINDRIYFLAGMYDDHTVELILSAEGNVKVIAFVEELVASAPVIAAWKFTALKPSLDIGNVNIAMGGYEFNQDNIFFLPNLHEGYPDEIDISIVHTYLNDENKDVINNGVFIFLDNYLGELNLVETIDEINVIRRNDAAGDLMPINKLKEYLIWRQKEFVEKYEGIRLDTENDSYSIREAELENGNKLLVILNDQLLDWDKKPSHPWVGILSFVYDGSNTNGMPVQKDYAMLAEIEEEILQELKDIDGYLNIGRQTADNIREIYFACKDFRKPSKVFAGVQQKYGKKFEIDFDIYKDKYWQSFNRFQ